MGWLSYLAYGVLPIWLSPWNEMTCDNFCRLGLLAFDLFSRSCINTYLRSRLGVRTGTNCDSIPSVVDPWKEGQEGDTLLHAHTYDLSRPMPMPSKELQVFSYGYMVVWSGRRQERGLVGRPCKVSADSQPGSRRTFLNEYVLPDQGIPHAEPSPCFSQSSSAP
ncbi:uncharacterized protein BDZ83DRAFT_647499 [Colletotrichum acutatum]|uniref:Uncharacterized protein n=1 Tax=Glomerella acutata TaxID=27357 RepID=A0AAD8XMC8_GLOAC|nr:uncharacterized protein BDZ83DRAFT_647499 [Colletotrichum acutatum]KAK1729944.1 hypothetical protein BDZ83DRAFT_647499 [Colletotrichum acutatum]